MPASIQIVLTDEEDRTLSELRVATTVPQRPRPSTYATAQCSRMDVPVIAEIFECHEHTVRALRRWQDKGLGDYGRLSDGVQNKNGKRLIYKLLNNGLSKTLAPSHQLAQKLSEQRQVKLSPRRLRHLLQKGFGWKRSSQPPRQARP